MQDRTPQIDRPAQAPRASRWRWLNILLLLVGIGVPGLFAASLLYTSAQMDLVVASSERSRAESLVNQIKRQFLQHVFDYSYWDEAYRNLVLRSDMAWFDENMGAQNYGSVLHTHAVLMDPAGNPIHGAWAEEMRLWDARDLLGADRVAKIVAALQASDRAGSKPSVDDGVAFFARLPDGFAVVAATLVLPVQPDLRDASAPDRILLLMRLLDADLLAEYSATGQLADLTIREAAAAEGPDDPFAIAIRGPDDAVLAVLAWNGMLPGGMVLARTAFPVTAATLLLLGLIFWVLRILRQSGREQAASEARAHHLAHHDMLTGLPNRRVLSERLATLPPDVVATLILLDLDGFKEVNDTLGHVAGDAVLMEITERLQATVPPEALLVRLGGDEFAILLEEGTAAKAPTALAERAIDEVAVPMELLTGQVRVGASAGVACRTAGVDGGELVRRADVAMYVAKQAGGSRVKFYIQEMDRGRLARAELESDLRAALDDPDQIRVVFQPIVSARDGRIAGVEALARWHHPTRGSIPPTQFVQVAEETGLILPLGTRILELACRAAKPWRGLTLAVNLSPVQFRQVDLVAEIARVLTTTGFPRERLELEVTEGVLVEHPQEAARSIERLQSLGIPVGLDDFGTGFASLGSLRRFGLNRIKLDRSYVDRIHHDPQADAVAAAVIAMGRALHLPVTAEGVETEEQAQRLRAAGCHCLQGYLFGRPMPAADIDRVLRDSAAA